MKFFFCIKSKSWFQYLNKNIQFWFSNLLFYYTLIIKLYLAIVMYSIAPRNFQDVLLCKQKYSILIFAIFCFTGSVSHHVRLVHLRRVLLLGILAKVNKPNKNILILHKHKLIPPVDKLMSMCVSYGICLCLIVPNKNILIRFVHFCQNT